MMSVWALRQVADAPSGDALLGLLSRFHTMGGKIVDQARAALCKIEENTQQLNSYFEAVEEATSVKVVDVDLAGVLKVATHLVAIREKALTQDRLVSVRRQLPERLDAALAHDVAFMLKFSNRAIEAMESFLLRLVTEEDISEIVTHYQSCMVFLSDSRQLLDGTGVVTGSFGHQDWEQPLKAGLDFIKKMYSLWQGGLDLFRTAGAVPALEQGMLVKLAELEGFHPLEQLPPSEHRSPLKEWYSQTVLPVVLEQLGRTSAPAQESVRKLYDNIQQFLVMGTVSIDEKKRVVEIILTMTFDADIDSMRKVALGQLASTRVESLNRLLVLAQLSCSAAPLKPFKHSPAHITSITRLHVAVDSASKFIDAHRASFLDLNAGWFADMATLDKAIRYARSVRDACMQDMLEDLQIQVKATHSHAPPLVLLTNKMVCTDVELQKTLLDNPHKGELSHDVESLSAAVREWMTLKGHGLFTAETTREVAKAEITKNHGKMAICVEYCMRKILREAPEDPAELASHTKKILAKVSRKGVQLPEYLANLLQTIEKTAAAAAASAAAAPAAAAAKPAAVAPEAAATAPVVVVVEPAAVGVCVAVEAAAARPSKRTKGR